MTAIDLPTCRADVPAPPGRMPAPRELASLFRPFSAGRAMLGRCHSDLQRYSPAAPRYVYWHLARFVKTLQYLGGIARPGARWLDLSSDPWFCLLAQSEFGLAPFPTGYCQQPLEFHAAGEPSYLYEPLSLEIRQDQREYPVGEAFDLVTAFELLEHLPFHPTPFLSAAAKALKPGGQLVISTPNITSWTAISRLLDGDAPYQTPHFAGPMSHAKEYAPFELIELVEETGFEVEALHTFNCYPGECRGVRSAACYAGALLWHAVMWQPGRVRNLLLRSGSTMLIVARKKRSCESTT
jgi:SAM-dependent methyltransferase